MMLRGCSAEEYVSRFGKKRNTLTQMFFRNMRKAAETGGSPYKPSQPNTLPLTAIMSGSNGP